MKLWFSWVVLSISLLMITLSLFVPGLAASPINKDSCTFKGKPLFGKVQVVDSFPDITVKIVTALPDIKVQIVNFFPDQCGEFQISNAFPDWKVQVVDASADLQIQFVDVFPGIP